MRFSARMCSALLAVFLFGPLWAGEADLDRAERLFREGEFRRAASLAARLVRRRATDAGSARAQALFVAASRAAGRAGNSDRFLRVAASRSAGADYFHALGSQLARLNEREAAERMLNRALELDPRAVTYAELGRLHASSGRREEAARAFEKLLEIEPGSFWARMELAKIYQLLGRPRDAENVYRGLENAGVRDKAYYVMLGYSLAGLGEPRRAESVFEKGAETNPNDPLALHHQATHLEKEGRTAEAERLYRKAVDLFDADPRTNVEEMLLPLHHLGDLYIAQKRAADAERIARKMESLRPRVPTEVPWDRIVLRPVQIYARLGRNERAEALCREALSRPPAHRYDRLMLLLEWVALLRRQGRTDEAKARALDAVRWLREAPLELERKKEYLRVSDLLTESLEALGLDRELQTVGEDLLDRWSEFLDHSDFARRVAEWSVSLRHGEANASLGRFSGEDLLDLFQTTTGLELAYFRPVAGRLLAAGRRRGGTSSELIGRLETLATRLAADFRVRDREEFIGRLVELFTVFEAAGKKDEALLLQKWVPLVVLKAPDTGGAAAFCSYVGRLRAETGEEAAAEDLFRRAGALFESTARIRGEDLAGALRAMAPFYAKRSEADLKRLEQSAAAWTDRLIDPAERSRVEAVWAETGFTNRP